MNADGETFGSVVDSSSPAEEPDLIRAYGDGGTIGYLKKVDLDLGHPKSPGDAAAFMAATRAKYPNGRVLNLYAEDGRTVIGTKTQGPPPSE